MPIALRSTAAQRGIHAALGYLNSRARSRFTGLFRPEPPNPRNIHLFDADHPTVDVSGNVFSLDDGYWLSVSQGRPEPQRCAS